MMQFLIAAPSSGSGKTTVACAVLAALKKRGADPCAFKSGPDYIDPMFHRSALQVDSHNLDLFLSNRDMVRAIFARYAAGHGAAVCEGAMGFYDGQGLTTRASAWELADTLGLPVLLVVQPKGASVTLAAQIQGLVNFRKNSHVSGILLNDCSEKLYKMLKALLERETGLPVLGYLPHLPQAAVESRHLGLKTADEIADLQEKIALLADALVLDWQRLAVLTEKPAPEALPGAAAPTSVRIAVAKDEAFCFTYAETLDALLDAGAELVLFSPVQDAVLPENIGGLYLPGGYPELYAAQLAANTAMRCAINTAVQRGLPTVADDSGLCVDALNGAPGVYSARYAGEHGNDAANNEKLMAEMQNVPVGQRAAKFVSAVCLILPDGRELVVTGECPGSVALTPAGDNGFGYDPLFVPDAVGLPGGGTVPNTAHRTYAELADAEKDAISHRGRAMEKLEAELAAFLGE